MTNNVADIAEPTGRTKMNAAAHAFAQRMMSRPIGESMISDPAHRIFYDPPELIQIAFGGRAWFHETDCTEVHRVGLFKGLGWTLSALVQKQDERGITGVRITARKMRRTAEGSPQLYDMEFVARAPLDPEDVSGPRAAPRVVTHRPGIAAENLKKVYGEVIGEHAL